MPLPFSRHWFAVLVQRVDRCLLIFLYCLWESGGELRFPAIIYHWAGLTGEFVFRAVFGLPLCSHDLVDLEQLRLGIGSLLPGLRWIAVRLPLVNRCAAARQLN